MSTHFIMVFHGLIFVEKSKKLEIGRGEDSYYVNKSEIVKISNYYQYKIKDIYLNMKLRLPA